jgi:hypothetical protein
MVSTNSAVQINAVPAEIYLRLRAEYIGQMEGVICVVPRESITVGVEVMIIDNVAPCVIVLLGVEQVSVVR